MTDVFIIGAYTTHFKRWPDKTHKQLTLECVKGLLENAGLSHGRSVEQVWFGNCGMHYWGQGNVRGQVCLDPVVQDGLLTPGVPVTNVEGGCATGTMAFAGAVRDVASGATEMSLALGVEKTFMPDAPANMLALFDGAMDQMDPERWKTYYAGIANELGVEFNPQPPRITILDVCALEIAHHMKAYGTTAEQIAFSAAKNHAHGADNPKAQYQKAMSVEEVLADKPVIGPLTRSMCSPISDGAAAALVCSPRRLRKLAPEVRERAVRVRACELTGGSYRSLKDMGPTARVAERVYSNSGLGPKDFDLVELHDATSFAEIRAVEDLGFCPVGEGGAFVASGATERGGEIPANLSGGLVSKGHPLAATGLAMISELTDQLRGEAGPRQLENAARGLAHNAGGLIGLDEAVTGLTVLEAV